MVFLFLVYDKLNLVQRKLTGLITCYLKQDMQQFKYKVANVGSFQMGMYVPMFLTSFQYLICHNKPGR